jgi:glucokinase
VTATPVETWAAPPVVAAVDVGGTRVKAALVDRDGREVVGLTRPTPAGLEVPGALVTLAADTVDALRIAAHDQGYAAHVAACGLVVPGIVDDDAGVARYSANLGWRDLEVSAGLTDRLELPVALGHDVRAGLLAEHRWGAAQGARQALFLPIGTGIAGALMLDGHVVIADGWSGELGHVAVDPDGPPCGCGARGHLEAIASASAIARAYAERSGEHVGADRVAALVQEGDPVATAVWGVAVDALARAIVMAVTLTGLDLVLVGGGLARSGAVLLDPLQTAIGQSLTFQRPPRLVEAALGDRAGCLGSACLAWDLV